MNPRLFCSLLCLCASAAEMPSWIGLGGEYRLRAEGFSGLRYQPENDDHYLLHRVRLNLKLTPAKWLRVHAQAQDSRIFWNSRAADAPPFQDALDLRVGYVELGDSEKGRIGLRVGRQEIAQGEERLVGSGNWGNTARSFDAVRLTLGSKAARVDVFAASVVAQRDGVFDRSVDGDDLHGVMARIDHPLGRLEPYGFWRLAPRVRAETGPFGKLDTKTLGTRWLRKAGNADVVVEVAVQTGRWGPEPARAWAGHWRVVQPIDKTKRIRGEYNYATGDKNPADGRHGTFELLYPTPHDKYGLADQVGWKNVHHLGSTAEWTVRKGWTAQAKYHNWWLASVTDGVYTAGGVLIARDPKGASGRHVGQEIDGQLLVNTGGHWQLGGGLGHVFPGEFLMKATPGASFTFPYVMLTWAF